MSEARNDRNTVQFGPSRTPQSYKLDRLEEEVKDLERETVQSINNTTQEITQYVDQSITNITGNAELLIGEVLTYVSATNSGTVDIDGATVNFLNASSVRLEAGDTIILSANEDYPDPFAVGLVSRNGGPVGYDTYEFVSPGVVPGLPRTVTPFGGVYFSPETPDLVTDGSSVAAIQISAGVITVENWDTATRTNIVLPAGVAADNNTYELSWCANGSVLVVGNKVSNVDSLHVYDGTSWTTYPYRGVTVAKRPANNTIYAIASKHDSGGGLVSGFYLITISSAGVVAHTDIDVSMGGDLQPQSAFCAAGGTHYIVGHVVNIFSGAGYVYVDGVAKPYTFGGAGQISYGGTAGHTSYMMEVYGDDLYFPYREDDDLNAFVPLTGLGGINALGIGVMDLTSPTLSTAVYQNIATSTALPKDGEPMQVTSVALLAGSKLAIGGRAHVAVFDAAYVSSPEPNQPTRPAVWIHDLTNGVTTIYASNDPRLTDYPWERQPDGTASAYPYVEHHLTSVASVPGGSELIMLVSSSLRTGFYTAIGRDWLEGLSV